MSICRSQIERDPHHDVLVVAKPPLCVFPNSKILTVAIHPTSSNPMQPEATTTSNTTQIWLDVTSLVAFLIGIFATLWNPEDSLPRWCFVAVLIVLSGRAWRNRNEFGKLFDAHSATPKTTGQLAILTIAGGVILLTFSFLTGAFRGNLFAAIFEKSTGEWLLVKIPTVIWQQLMLQLILAPILLRLFRKVSLAVVTGAFIFALIHLPNPLLMGLTLIAGLVWTHHFYHSRKIFPIIVSHAVLAILAAGFCGEYVLNMRVGAACLSMLPQKIDSDSGPTFVFPNSIVGSALRLTQTGDQLTIEGWVYDCVHHTCPESLSLMVDHRLTQIDDVNFESASVDRWPELSSIGFAVDNCFAFTAKVPISQTRTCPTQNGLEKFRLFARNLNGHVAELGQRGALAASPLAMPDRTIVLFPVELDGRIDWVGQQAERIRLRGWAADLQTNSLVDEICIASNGHLQVVRLSEHRLRRPGTAKAFNQPEFLDCGFEITLSDLDFRSLNHARIFAVDKKQQLHPLEFTESAQAKIANFAGGENSVLR